MEFLDNKKIIFACLIFICVGQFAIQYRETFWPVRYMLVLAIVVSLFFMIIRIRDESKLAYNTFIIIAIFGCINAVILPLRRNLDENTHYHHVLELADGNFRSQTTELGFLQISPDFMAVTKVNSEHRFTQKESEKKEYQKFLETKTKKTNYDINNEKIVSPQGFINPAYIPAAIGVKIGHLVSNKVFVSYYLGRIVNLLFYAVLAFFAVKISKNYKLQLFAIATTSFSLWITAGYSYDTLYYGLILLVVSQFMNFLDEENTITTKKMIGYGITCFGLIFCKAPTVLLILLPLFLPQKYYRQNNGRIKNMIVVVSIAIFSVIWLLQGVFLKALGVIKPFNDSASVSSGSRLTEFFSSPLYTMGVCFRSLFDVIRSTSQQIMNPQPFLAQSAMSFVNLIAFVFILILVSYHLKIHSNKKIRIVFCIVSLIIIAGTVYAISGDARVFKMGDLVVDGVQGRYFYFLLAFLPWIIAPKVQDFFQKGADVDMKSTNTHQVTVTIICLITFINTCIGVFGYL
jgi:uncharacterized membrane protein